MLAWLQRPLLPVPSEDPSIRASTPQKIPKLFSIMTGSAHGACSGGRWLKRFCKVGMAHFSVPQKAESISCFDGSVSNVFMNPQPCLREHLGYNVLKNLNVLLMAWRLIFDQICLVQASRFHDVAKPMLIKLAVLLSLRMGCSI